MATVAILSIDIFFAMDSIPAIFGITHTPYLVFTANAFFLLGLRALDFLVVGLLDRLYRPSIRARFEERFSARAMATDYLKIYGRLAAIQNPAAAA